MEPIPSRQGLQLPGEVTEPGPQFDARGVRRTPGEIAPEAVRPRAYTARPAQPIPRRSGLQLSGEIEPQRLIEQVRTADEVTPALKNPRPDYYETDEQAWQRYPTPGSAEDLGETRSLQEQIRDQYDAEQRKRLSRGNEEGFAMNTRPRTSKSELQRRFASP